MRPFMGPPVRRLPTPDCLELDIPESMAIRYEKAYFEEEIIELPSGKYRVAGGTKFLRRSSFITVYLREYREQQSIQQQPKQEPKYYD